MIPYRLALIACFLPFFSVHITWLLSVASDNLELCFPYWSHCHSISATGRQYPEFFVFKALLIPTAVFMSAYWILLHHWVKQLTNDDKGPVLITTMGVIASVALVVYTVTLGAVGDAYALARRVGVVFYFAFTSFGHLFLLKWLNKIDTEALGIVQQQNNITIVCTLLITTAIASALVGIVWEGWDNWENAYEWWFSVFMISLFYFVAQMWRLTNYTLKLDVVSKTN